MSISPPSAQQARESPLGAEEMVIEFTDEEFGPDELYDIRRELAAFGERSLAARADVEYRNSLRYEDYWPTFEAQSLTSILIILGNCQYQHISMGNEQRATLSKQYAELIGERFNEWAEEHDIDLAQEIGLGVPESGDEIERDHSRGRERAKHGEGERDSADIDVEAEAGPLEEATGPDAVEEEEIRSKPKEPDTPGGPDGSSDDDPGGA